MRKHLEHRHLAALVECAYNVLETCIKHGLECVDPPVATTACLRARGYSEGFVKGLWARLPRETRIPVYRVNRVLEVNMVLVHDKGPVCHASDKTPVDLVECDRIGGEKASISNRLFAYIESVIENNMLRFNILRLLVLAWRAGFDSLRLARAALKAIQDGECDELLRMSSELVAKSRVYLRALSPYMPTSVEELVRRSAVLRMALSLCKSGLDSRPSANGYL